MIFPPRLLNKETRSMIEKISNADGNHTIAANVVFHTTVIMLYNDNIAYLNCLCNNLEKLIKSKNKIPQKKDELFEEKNSIIWCYIMMAKK